MKSVVSMLVSSAAQGDPEGQASRRSGDCHQVLTSIARSTLVWLGVRRLDAETIELIQKELA